MFFCVTQKSVKKKKVDNYQILLSLWPNQEDNGVSNPIEDLNIGEMVKTDLEADI